MPRWSECWNRSASSNDLNFSYFQAGKLSLDWAAGCNQLKERNASRHATLGRCMLMVKADSKPMNMLKMCSRKWWFWPLTCIPILLIISLYHVCMYIYIYILIPFLIPILDSTISDSVLWWDIVGFHPLCWFLPHWIPAVLKLKCSSLAPWSCPLCQENAMQTCSGLWGLGPWGNNHHLGVEIPVQITNNQMVVWAKGGSSQTHEGFSMGIWVSETTR